MVNITNYVVIEQAGTKQIYLELTDRYGAVIEKSDEIDGDSMCVTPHCLIPVTCNEETAKLLKGGQMTGYLIKTSTPAYKVRHTVTQKFLTFSFGYSYKSSGCQILGCMRICDMKL